MRRLAAGTLVFASLLTGCAADVATLELSGEGGGERSRSVACEGDGGFAAVVLSLAARADEGASSFLVRDGAGVQRLERHVAPLSGDVDQETTLTGTAGDWAIEERRTDDFRGELRATLGCAP